MLNQTSEFKSLEFWIWVNAGRELWLNWLSEERNQWMKQPKPEEKIERNACLSDRLRGGLSEGLAAKALIKEMAEEMTAI